MLHGVTVLNNHVTECSVTVLNDHVTECGVTRCYCPK